MGDVTTATSSRLTFGASLKWPFEELQFFGISALASFQTSGCCCQVSLQTNVIWREFWWERCQNGLSQKTQICRQKMPYCCTKGKHLNIVRPKLYVNWTCGISVWNTLNILQTIKLFQCTVNAQTDLERQLRLICILGWRPFCTSDLSQSLKNPSAVCRSPSTSPPLWLK